MARSEKEFKAMSLSAPDREKVFDLLDIRVTEVRVHIPGREAQAVLRCGHKRFTVDLSADPRESWDVDVQVNGPPMPPFIYETIECDLVGFWRLKYRHLSAGRWKL